MAYFKYKDHKLFYLEKGSGPLLVILPGNTAASPAHASDVERFSSRFRSIALDFLGTGRSDRLASWPVEWWREGAEQTAALIRHLGYREAVLLGTSGGAITALLTAIHYPSVVRAVIADSFMESFSSESVRHGIVEERARPTSEQTAFWKSMHGDDWQDVVDSDTGMLVAFAAGGGNCFRAGLEKVRCRVLMTGSREDSHIPSIEEQYRSLAQQIPDCEIFLNETGWHPLMWSHPEVFYPLADSFLDSYE